MAFGRSSYNNALNSLNRTFSIATDPTLTNPRAISYFQSYYSSIQTILDDSISIGYIRKNSGGIVVYEVKKSSKLERPVRNQVLYYLWYIKQKGIDASAVITYPKERRRETLALTHEDEKNIESILREIREIISKDVPPPPLKKPYCRRCSYFNLCWR